MPLPSSRYPASRGTGDAALILAVVAVAVGAIAVPLGLAWVLPIAGEPASRPAVLELVVVSAPVVAGISWLLAVPASATAVTALLLDRRNRRARTALLLAAPGSVLGAAAIVAVVLWLASLRPIV